VALSYRPVLETLRKLAHNDRACSLAEQVTAKYDRALGPISLKQRVLAKAALAYARREARRATAGCNVYQPKAAAAK